MATPLFLDASRTGAIYFCPSPDAGGGGLLRPDRRRLDVGGPTDRAGARAQGRTVF